MNLYIIIIFTIIKMAEPRRGNNCRSRYPVDRDFHSDCNYKPKCSFSKFGLIDVVPTSGELATEVENLKHLLGECEGTKKLLSQQLYYKTNEKNSQDAKVSSLMNQVVDLENKLYTLESQCYKETANLKKQIDDLNKNKTETAPVTGKLPGVLPAIGGDINKESAAADCVDHLNELNACNLNLQSHQENPLSEKLAKCQEQLRDEKSKLKDCGSINDALIECDKNLTYFYSKYSTCIRNTSEENIQKTENIIHDNKTDQLQGVPTVEAECNMLVGGRLLELVQLENGGVYYVHVNTFDTKTWQGATEYCHKNGMELINIETIEEQNLVSGLVTLTFQSHIQLPAVWIGLSELSGTGDFTLSGTGGPVEFQNWHRNCSSRAGDQCVELVRLGLDVVPKWRIVDCKKKNLFVCELVGACKNYIKPKPVNVEKYLQKIHPTSYYTCENK